MVEVNFKKIEKKWQKRWEKEKVFLVKEDSKKKKFYSLEMFPYPSGSGLHIGHALNYIIGDIFARFKIMKGFNVLHPMGYDALGLPAENAAIKVGTHPEEYTKNSMRAFTKQLKLLGLSYDWSRMVDTSNPGYYKWDQWIFLKMFESGLAYQKESSVNWCPECNTVLANEQVVDGKCWRHEDTKVELKSLKQWFLKITDYADELLDKLDDLNWPERTKNMQKHWIGKSYGTEIDFKVNGQKWPVFTTRPDTIYGVTFVVVSPYHKEIDKLVTKEQKKEVNQFMNKLKSVSEKDLVDLEKEGAFTGSYAINPINNEAVPIYVGNFVVADYGSGMVMAVPAHDKRDFEFAKKYGIKIKIVIDPIEFELDEKNLTEAYTESGTLINSGNFNGISNEKAKHEISEFLSKKGLGRKAINFRLKDWGISRQRYWGTPIPIIYCDSCGAVPVPLKDLPVKLPKEVKFGNGNPLLTNEKWINIKCPKCGKNGKRETDTMDTFVNSSWYFLRYTDSKNKKEIFNKEKVVYWNPVDVYVGGAEHACMHLIYSRFYVKFLRDIGLLNFDEPAKRLFHQGMIHSEGGSKMSKSKGNVVDPLLVSKKYGVDALRFFLVSVASPDKDFDWSETGIQGSFRFIKKIYDYFDKFKEGKDSEKISLKMNSSIKSIGDYIENFDYRKATIELRELFDLISEEEVLSKETLQKFLKLMSPFCPHLSEEFWEKLGNKNLITSSLWPEFKEDKIGKKSEENLSEKIIENLSGVLHKLESNGNKISKVYFYVLPFEIEKINKKKLQEGFEKEIFVYSVKDDKKYDPEGRSKKARPGMPGFYFE
ncbi:leucine--tRNA ligase [Candidatus Pacearchaeota archaeon CG_4_9_14_3_um_filter_30_11]|nr:MAG: leucine--tRNA ligase [Candidatus Pacearchaeota archaeon CG11_big_fil_rev_8_21_14_0_20_30_13]PJA71015.1 MAG: leucine--tRNA ligase [Candidatus Pacearchaeota archaeon CG_4_9_14_3_um_filter_30_11]